MSKDKDYDAYANGIAKCKGYLDGVATLASWGAGPSPAAQLEHLRALIDAAWYAVHPQPEADEVTA